MKIHQYIITVCCSVSLFLIGKATAFPDNRNIADSIMIQSNGRVKINQSVELKQMLDRNTTGVLIENEAATVNRVGFRIQVYSDNKQREAKSNASRIATSISQAFPDLGTYLSYKAPYWRLRVGDFRDHEEAEAMLEELKSKFPTLSSEMIIVKDRISIVE